MNDEPAKKPGIGTMPWFRPVYRRVIVVAIVACWCAWEWLFNQDQFWGLLTLAALAYAIWTFFINFENELKKVEDGKPKS